MIERHGTARWKAWGWMRGWTWAAVLCVTAASAWAQSAAPAPPQQPSASAPPPGAAQNPPSAQAPAKIITPEQARKLFASVDEIMKFASGDTGLPIKHQVKRQLTTRAAVEKYLEQKFNDDKDAKRMERDEIVLKKFDLLDRDFALKPFLLALLKEQIEAYYDTKTKTIYLLNWVNPDEQKSVLAHELTHALQDQRVGLEKWDDQTPDDVSHTASGDEEHLAKDEMDTARDAVVEGQATAVMLDYALKPMGKSLVKDPEISKIVEQHMNGTDSPVMSRAPLVLSESMLFPYRQGLSFEQDIWTNQGRTAAFAGALDRPPSSSWEIINPRDYEQHLMPPVPLLPDIHPLVDKLYRPYDIGQVGQLDVHILTQLFGGAQAARDLTPAWDGGLYWAGQLRSAKTPAEQDTTKSLALFYLSIWKNAATAQEFAKLFAGNLGREYSHLKADQAAQASAPQVDGEVEQVYSTEEGAVVITTRGNMVFVAESFPLDLARKLTEFILDAQGAGEMHMAILAPPYPAIARPAAEPLTAGLVRFFENCGVMKDVVDAVGAAR
jgi:hypothetical protein